MEIKFAKVSDASIIRDLMIKAFMEYKEAVPPSGALDETVHSVSNDLKNGEQCLIGCIDSEPVGMVRVKLKDRGLYFFRLSVIPEKRSKGIAKKLLKSLEEYASKREISTMFCRVRMTVPKNIKLYHSVGYEIYDEEIVHKPNGININVVSMKKEI